MTAELRDVHVVRVPFDADDQLEITGELFKVFHQLRTRASTVSKASRLSSGLQAATSSLSKWPRKDWRRRRAPRSRCRASSIHDAPAVLRKELKALRLKAEQKLALVQRYVLRL